MEKVWTQFWAGPANWLDRRVPRYASNRRLMAYVAGVIVSGLGLLVGAFWIGRPSLSLELALWVAICLGAEYLWLETISGEGTESMATTANLAAVLLLPLPAAVCVIAVSVFVATRLIQRRDWVKSFFGLGQMTWTALLVGGLFHLFHPGPVDSLRSFREAGAILGFVVVAAGYFFANTFLVVGAMAIDRNLPFWQTWRTNYAYRNAVLSSLGLCTLTPLLVLSVLSFGEAGALLFFLPLLLIKNQNREYINLDKAMSALIQTEKLAAKGEFAASVAHEIRNFLSVLSGHAQLLQIKAQRLNEPSILGHCDAIRQQIQLLSTLTKGLLEFSHREVEIQRFDVNRMILESIDFVRLQNSFDDVEITPTLEPDLSEIEADPAQLNQVMLNLLLNAAEAMHDAPSAEARPPAIEIRTHRVKSDRISIVVLDNGPGMPRAVAEKIFDFGFTTKKNGHGYGLATCHRIVENHQGKIRVESEQGRGTTFVIELPRKARSASVGASPIAHDEEGARGAA